jgi:DNA excision repair protein ERCC-2
VQKTRPETYQPEVSIRHDVSTPEVTMQILGRIDGVWPREGGVLLEEIKSVTRSWDYSSDPLHWAQIKLYGWMYCIQNALDAIELQLTYFHLETEEITVFRQGFARLELEQFAEPVIAEYMEWLRDDCAWRKTRNVAIEQLVFPYGKFREGQRKLCSAIYKTVVHGGKLFVEAPTGSGKTISALFPTIKALPKTRHERVFFLTAKTTTQAMAEKAFADLRVGGLPFRSMTISAREKMCSQEGKLCDPATCPLAQGYFDRRKPAIRDGLKREQLTPEAIQEIARKHMVCPHELSLDISEWVDAIVCDYNYVFDPSACLKRHFADNTAKTVLLIDEAHNLVDRARAMFSAQLGSAQFREARTVAPVRRVRNALTKVEKQLRGLWSVDGDESVSGREPMVHADVPEEIVKVLEKFLDSADSWFAQNSGTSCDPALLEVYFNTISFLQICESYDAQYRTIIERFGTDVQLKLYCLDPSTQLRNALERIDATVFISATLTPLDYFRSALGGGKDDEVLRLPSPFPPDNLRVLLADRITTAFRNRASSLEEVCATLQAFVSARTGNYLIYFPSYAYLNDVMNRLQVMLSDVHFVAQKPDMKTIERDEYLSQFTSQNGKTLVGFAVMGGIFGEGIDLVGERLIGVAVVGVGLPQVCLERNLMRRHFDEQGMDGFAYAYLYPGINRVLQAAGRLIRSEQDRGTILLLDARFGEARFSELLPAWWSVKRSSKPEQLRTELQKWWQTP